MIEIPHHPSKGMCDYCLEAPATVHVIASSAPCAGQNLCVPCYVTVMEMTLGLPTCERAGDQEAAC